METTRITVTLDSEQAADLARASDENGIPVSALVRYAVSRLLADRVIFLSAVHTLSTQKSVPEHAGGTR